MGTEAVIYVLDDDAAVREGLGRLMKAAGFEVRSCASEDELVSSADASVPGCVLFDLSAALGAPGSLSHRLEDRGIHMPLIALTGAGASEMQGNARAKGADFLFSKPVDARALLDAIGWVMGDAR